LTSRCTYGFRKYLNRAFAYYHLTLPHIISSLTKWIETPRSGSWQSDWLLHSTEVTSTFRRQEKCWDWQGEAQSAHYQHRWRGICGIKAMGDPAPCQNTTAVYHPRKPTDSPLYRLLQTHFDHFEQVYDERF